MLKKQAAEVGGLPRPSSNSQEAAVGAAPTFRQTGELALLGIIVPLAVPSAPKQGVSLHREPQKTPSFQRKLESSKSVVRSIPNPLFLRAPYTGQLGSKLRWHDEKTRFFEVFHRER